MPLADIVSETNRILESAEQKQIVLRLLGGLAVRFHCPSAIDRHLQRRYADVDFMALREQSKQIQMLFVELGYEPRRTFNKMQGHRRLVFNDLENARRIDIFLNILDMCHRFDLRNRLTLDKPTIPLADLLATKLQVVQITEREYKDVITLVHDHEVGDSDSPETINGTYIAKLCANDWGIYKTLSVNINNILLALPGYQLDEAYESVTQSVFKK